MQFINPKSDDFEIKVWRKGGKLIFKESGSNSSKIIRLIIHENGTVDSFKDH